MDSDDPIVHSKIFKFIKSKGKSFMEYYWNQNSDSKCGKSIEMKGKGEPLKSSNDLSVSEIQQLLKAVKIFNTKIINNLSDLWENMRSVMLLVVKEKNAYSEIEKWLKDTAKIEVNSDLKVLYESTSELFDNWKAHHNKLACDINISSVPKHWKGLLKYSDFKSLSKSYYLLNQYLKVDRAIDRLLDLAIDVEDLHGMLQKYKDEPDKIATYRSEYNHYLTLLRVNFEFLREDSVKMQEKEEKNLKNIIHEYYAFQVEYLKHQNLIFSD